jgi:hypothetical protein
MSYGGIAFLQSSERCYGVRGKLMLPCTYDVNGADRQNYFDAYLALVNPLAADDPRVEAGLMRYPSKTAWSPFYWSPISGAKKGDKLGEWQDSQLTRPSSSFVQLKLMFVANDAGKIDFFVDNQLIWRSRLGTPISSASYSQGGLAAKVCIGLDHQDKSRAVRFDSLSWSNLEVAKDPDGKQWMPFSVATRGAKGNPIPRILSASSTSLVAAYP